MRSSYFVMIILLDSYLMMIQLEPMGINKQDKELLSVNIFMFEEFI